MKQLLFCSDNGSFNGFLQLPIRPNSIFPLSVVYGIMGWGMFVCRPMYSCMYVCINVCISLYMYVLCMHNTYICDYVCMYAFIQIQIKFITRERLHRNVNLRR